METLDRDLQKRVWNRVYGKQPQPQLTSRQRQQLRQALQRSESNLVLYRQLTGHAVYGQAFHHLATESAEHVKMLRQMLQI